MILIKRLDGDLINLNTNSNFSIVVCKQDKSLYCIGIICDFSHHSKSIVVGDYLTKKQVDLIMSYLRTAILTGIKDVDLNALF